MAGASASGHEIQTLFLSIDEMDGQDSKFMTAETAIILSFFTQFITQNPTVHNGYHIRQFEKLPFFPYYKSYYIKHKIVEIFTFQKYPLDIRMQHKGQQAELSEFQKQAESAQLNLILIRLKIASKPQPK